MLPDLALDAGPRREEASATSAHTQGTTPTVWTDRADYSVRKAVPIKHRPRITPGAEPVISDCATTCPIGQDAY